MGINFDVTAATPILRQRYTDKKIETLAFVSPLLGILPKDPNKGGSLYVGAVRNAVTSAVSASDTVAFTSGSASTYQQWQCPWRFGYTSGNLTGAAIDQANGDANALVDAMVSEFDGAFVAAGIHIAQALYGNGGGSIGQISSGSTPATSATITLADPSRITSFYVGQILNAATTDGTSGSVLTGSVTVSAVSVSAGTITVNGANWAAGISGIAASDYLFNQGDFGAKLIGLSGWLPDINNRGSLSTPFNNVNRSTDPDRLAGVAYNGGGGPKSESMIQLAALVGRMGGRPDTFLCNPLAYADIVKELSTRTMYTPTKVGAFGEAGISFDGVKVATPYGTIDVVQDPFCPQGDGYMLMKSTWLLPSMGKVPKVLGEGIDGMKWLRQSGSDSYQLRVGYRATTYCSAPGWNGVVTW
jgi:hypothetical protein